MDRITEQQIAENAHRADQRERLNKLGWTSRPRYEDHDTDKPIIGVRLMNCAKLFDRAQSIQVFDATTVTLQWGFMQEDSVSLTKEDGAEFMQWLRIAHPDLAAAALDLVPAGDPTPGARAEMGVNTSKGRLVTYLVEAFPDVFGRGGRASQVGSGDFYYHVLEILQAPSRDDANRGAMILMCENMAHDLYAQANVYLKHAARSGAAKDKPIAALQLQLEAYGATVAAESARAYAGEIRNRLAAEKQPPRPTWGDAIDPNTIPVVENVRAAMVGAERPGAPTIPAAPFQIDPAKADTLRGHLEEVSPGDMVGVIDATHALFRQMGRIEAIRGERITVAIAGQPAPLEFEPAQLMALA